MSRINYLNFIRNIEKRKRKMKGHLTIDLLTNLYLIGLLKNLKDIPMFHP